MSTRPTAAPQKVDLLLSGCDVVTIDGSNRVIRDGAVAIKGNKIVWIGKASAARRNVVAKSTIDGSGQIDRKSTRLNSSHVSESRMPSSA